MTKLTVKSQKGKSCQVSTGVLAKPPMHWNLVSKQDFINCKAFRFYVKNYSLELLLCIEGTIIYDYNAFGHQIESKTLQFGKDIRTLADTKHFTDFDFIVHGKKFSVHRNILAGRKKGNRSQRSFTNPFLCSSQSRPAENVHWRLQGIFRKSSGNQ